MRSANTLHRRESADRAGSLESAEQPSLTGVSRAIRSAVRQADAFAPHESIPVLLEGESGTGKSIFARYIHARSPRRNAALHIVDLGTLSDSLAASDLFGHVAGSFTDARHSRPGHFVAGHRGTLFLDEIAKASHAVQRKLLRVIESGEVVPVGAERTIRVDARLIIATNVPLGQLAESGEFLPDLYARIGGFRIRIPPLRERKADIPALAVEILRHRARILGYGASPSISPDLLDVLLRAAWPFNVRQLDATLTRLLIEANGAAELDIVHCRDELTWLLQPSTGRAGGLTDEQITQALKVAGSVTGAAAVLGVSRAKLYRHLGRQR